VVLLLAGGYVAYYGWYELRGNVDDPIIDAAQSLQRLLVQTVERPNVVWIAVLFGLLLSGALAAGAIRARQVNRTPGAAQHPDDTRAAR
jgi:hypothetical protein